MPIYEYRCQKCGKIFEKYLRVDEREGPLKCPSCGAEDPEKVLSGFSSLKGSTCGPSGSTRFS